MFVTLSKHTHRTRPRNQPSNIHAYQPYLNRSTAHYPFFFADDGHSSFQGDYRYTVRHHGQQGNAGIDDKRGDISEAIAEATNVYAWPDDGVLACCKSRSHSRGIGRNGMGRCKAAQKCSRHDYRWIQPMKNNGWRHILASRFHSICSLNQKVESRRQRKLCLTLKCQSEKACPRTKWRFNDSVSLKNGSS